MKKLLTLLFMTSIFVTNIETKITSKKKLSTSTATSKKIKTKKYASRNSKQSYIRDNTFKAPKNRKFTPLNSAGNLESMDANFGGKAHKKSVLKISSHGKNLPNPSSQRGGGNNLNNGNQHRRPAPRPPRHKKRSQQSLGSLSNKPKQGSENASVKAYKSGYKTGQKASRKSMSQQGLSSLGNKSKQGSGNVSVKSYKSGYKAGQKASRKSMSQQGLSSLRNKSNQRSRNASVKAYKSGYKAGQKVSQNSMSQQNSSNTNNKNNSGNQVSGSLNQPVSPSRLTQNSPLSRPNKQLHHLPVHPSPTPVTAPKVSNPNAPPPTGLSGLNTPGQGPLVATKAIGVSTTSSSSSATPPSQSSSVQSKVAPAPKSSNPNAPPPTGLSRLNTPGYGPLVKAKTIHLSTEDAFIAATAPPKHKYSHSSDYDNNNYNYNSDDDGDYSTDTNESTYGNYLDSSYDDSDSYY